MRPVRLEPHHFLRFTIRDHFLKSPKYAIKINAKKIYPPEPHQNFKACAATEYTCEEYLSRFEMEFTLMSAWVTFSDSINNWMLEICSCYQKVMYTTSLLNWKQTSVDQNPSCRCIRKHFQYSTNVQLKEVQKLFSKFDNSQSRTLLCSK